MIEGVFMPKRLKKILDRFASGEIKTTYNLKQQLEDKKRQINAYLSIL